MYLAGTLNLKTIAYLGAGTRNLKLLPISERKHATLNMLPISDTRTITRPQIQDRTLKICHRLKVTFWCKDGSLCWWHG